MELSRLTCSLNHTSPMKANNVQVTTKHPRKTSAARFSVENMSKGRDTSMSKDPEKKNRYVR